MVLTGFLGSGKTTLLSRLLRQPEFSRTAVIINEFGDIGLDHELVEASGDSIIALQTGCLCCKIRSDLATTIHDLLRRRDEGSVTAFDRVVIETSGLADPAPILQTLMTDRDDRGPYRARRRRHHCRCSERRTHPRPRGDFRQAGRRSPIAWCSPRRTSPIKESPNCYDDWRRSTQRRRFCRPVMARSTRNGCSTAGSTILSPSPSMFRLGLEPPHPTTNMHTATMSILSRSCATNPFGP